MYESVSVFSYRTIKFENNRRNEAKNFIKSNIAVFICKSSDRLKATILMEISWSRKWKRVEKYNDDRYKTMTSKLVG